MTSPFKYRFTGKNESTLTSRDGTPIAYVCRGGDPALILIGSGHGDGSENEPLANELASEFTTYNYARRSRAVSGDTRRTP